MGNHLKENKFDYIIIAFCANSRANGFALLLRAVVPDWTYGFQMISVNNCLRKSV